MNIPFLPVNTARAVRQRARLWTVVALLLVFLGYASESLRAADSPSGQNTAVGQLTDKDLVGSWNLTFSFRLKMRISFLPGGVLIAEGAGPYSTGQGAWERTNRGDYAFTFFYDVFDPQGALAFVEKDRGVLTLDASRDTAAGQDFAEGVTPAGQTLFAAPSTFQASRIKVEPMP